MSTRPRSVQDARSAAAGVLAQVLGEGRSLNQCLPVSAEHVVPRDHGLLRELCYGALRWQPRLDRVLSQLLSKPLKKKDADIQGLLLLGLYQLVYTRVPDHAAINACVEGCKTLGKPWAAKLVNGVLRNFQRQRETLESRLADDPIYLHSHPQWLMDALREAWPTHWQAILNANNAHPPMTLRVNREHHSRDAYLAHLAKQSIEAVATPLSDDGITLTQPREPWALPGFAEGWVSVQDEAAQLAAALLQLAPGQRVLDACCAPGGKTGHILEREQHLAQLVGVDQEPERLTRVSDNLARLGLQAKLIAADVANLDHWWDGQAFDRILLDVPCSATGVIRRHPDIKLLRRTADIAKLATLQRRLLEQLWQCLSPGGLLVYATCSVMPTENDQVVTAFVKDTPNAQDEPIAADWGHGRPAGRQLLPQPGGHDGFYYACLRKRPNTGGTTD